GALQLRKPAPDTVRERAHQELVVLEYELLADARSPQRAEQLGALGGPVGPVHRAQEGLEHDDAAHAVGVTRSPIEREDSAPVVADQHDVAQVELREPRIEVARVIDEAIRAVGLAGAAHADEVRREAARGAGEMRDHVAAYKRGRGVAVQKYDRRAAAGVAVGDERVENFEGACSHGSTPAGCTLAARHDGNGASASDEVVHDRSWGGGIVPGSD